jgi:electron transport complex protein RnfC
MPIMKGTSGILALPEKMVDKHEEQPCIACSSCVDVCPMKLLPTTMAKFIKNKKYQEAKEINLLACIECGSCAYVCPSHIPLVQYFRVGKAALRKIAAKEKAKEGGK